MRGSFSECKDGIVNTNYTGKAEAYTFTEEKRIEYKDFQFDYGYIRFIYSLDFLRANGLYFPPYRRFQDPPFFVSVMVKAKWFYAVPKVTYCYRKGEKRIRWTHEKINDAVKGMIDNLKISKENDLSKLHTFTVERLNIEYYRAIALNLTRDNIELMQLLLHANSIVEPKMLIENGYDLDTERQYMLRILSDLYGAWWRKVHPKSLIKRFIDLVKRAIICYKDNGLTYTIKRAVKKIGG